MGRAGTSMGGPQLPQPGGEFIQRSKRIIPMPVINSTRTAMSKARTRSPRLGQNRIVQLRVLPPEHKLNAAKLSALFKEPRLAGVSHISGCADSTRMSMSRACLISITYTTPMPTNRVRSRRFMSS